MAVEVATLQFKADTKQLERSEKHLRDLGTESKKTEKSVEKLRKKLKQSANDSRYYGESTKKAVVGTRKLGKAFVGLAASLGLVAVSVKTVSIAREFDIINASLKTMTGSQAAADKAFTRIQEFAATTPFDLQQVAGAFVKLKSLGLEPSEEALLSYGNTASAMGYSLNQMVEAVADASTMEFERLKAFGIKAKQSADEVTFIFQGVSTSVKKNSNDIQEYLLAIGQTEFAGAMAERAKTLDGAISNLGDTFDSLFLTIAQGDQGIMNDVVRGMEGALARIRDAIALTNGTASLDLQLGEVQRDLEYYEQQIEASGEFLANLLGLTDKRDEILAERQRLLDEIAKQNKEAAESEAAAARKAAIEKLYTDKELADAARAEALKDAADFIKQLEALNDTPREAQKRREQELTDELKELKDKKLIDEQTYQELLTEITNNGIDARRNLQIEEFDRQRNADEARLDRLHEENDRLMDGLIVADEKKKESAMNTTDAILRAEDLLLKGKSEKQKAGFRMAVNLANAEKRENAKQIVSDSYTAAMKAYKALAGIPIIGPALGAAAAAVIITAGVGYAAQSLSGRALGGQVRAGESYVVGERGPEVLTMGGSGNITTNQQIRNTPQQAVANKTANVNFNITANDTEGFEDLLINRRGTIIDIINEALNDNGQAVLV